jgi:hypothetical protein
LDKANKNVIDVVWKVVYSFLLPCGKPEFDPFVMVSFKSTNSQEGDSANLL